MRLCPTVSLQQHRFQKREILENIYTNLNVFIEDSCKILKADQHATFRFMIQQPLTKNFQIKISIVQNGPDQYILVLQHQRLYQSVCIRLLMTYIELVMDRITATANTLFDNRNRNSGYFFNNRVYFKKFVFKKNCICIVKTKNVEVRIVIMSSQLTIFFCNRAKGNLWFNFISQVCYI